MLTSKSWRMSRKKRPAESALKVQGPLERGSFRRRREPLSRGYEDTSCILFMSTIFHARLWGKKIISLSVVTVVHQSEALLCETRLLTAQGFGAKLCGQGGFLITSQEHLTF